MSDKNWWFIVDITDYPDVEIVGRRILKDSAEKDKKIISRDRAISENMLVLVEADDMYKAMEDAPRYSKMPKEWFDNRIASSDFSNIEKEIEVIPDDILYGTSRALEEEKLDVGELVDTEENKHVSKKQRKSTKHKNDPVSVPVRSDTPAQKIIILARGDMGEKPKEPKKITVSDLIRTRKFDPTDPMQIMEYERSKQSG